MEKKLRITVEGKSYLVTVEDLTDTAAPVPGPALAGVPVAAPLAAPLAPSAAPAAAVAAGAGDAVAPLAGVVQSLPVAVGQAVKAGDTVAVLEAMKMKTVIAAPCDGRVASIAATVGQAVETGQVLVSIA